MRRCLRPWPIRCTAALALLAGCTTSLEPAAPSEPAAQAPAWRLAQRGHGAQAAFSLCQPPSCAAPTPKTLAQAPRPVAWGPNQPPAPQPLAPATRATVADDVPVQTTAALQVHFRFGNARLDGAARTTLREALPDLRQARHLTLVGHTDAIGPPAANLRLSKARAESVRQALAVLAPDLQATVAVSARGACCAADPEDSPAGRARNRRVEILLDPPDPHPP